MPTVSFIPYFPDEEVDRSIGQFRLWNWARGRDGLQIDANVREFLDRYFGCFRRANGDPETRIAILSPDHGDLFPDNQDLMQLGKVTNCLMAAYLFNLPANDTGWGFCSSDNFTGMSQRFTPTTGVPTVALSFGSYFKTLTAGSWDHLQFSTPQCVPDIFGATPTEEMLNALAALCPDNSEPVVRLFRSLDWLKLAFMNYEGFQLEARPVALCTGFETLLDFPDRAKTSYFSDTVNKLFPPNHMVKTSRQVRTKLIDDTPVGWWCRDFYGLRSRIVHGEQIPAADWRNGFGVEHLRLALNIFEMCVWGLLFEWGRISSDQRIKNLVWRSDWLAGLGLNLSTFIP